MWGFYATDEYGKGKMGGSGTGFCYKAKEADAEYIY